MERAGEHLDQMHVNIPPLERIVFDGLLNQVVNIRVMC